MTLFDSLSKPGWEHHEPDVRKKAIAELDDQQVLSALVRQDPDEAVRACALTRISDSVLLDDFALSLTGGLQKQARAQRLAQLLTGADQLASITDDSLLVKVAGLTDDPLLVEDAISRVQDPANLMQVAGNHPLAKVRVCAARALTDPGQLHELMNQTRHKDKAVFRHCKDVLDQHHAAERAVAERQSQLERLTLDASALANGVDSPEYKARYGTLNARWKELEANASEVQRQEIQADLDICAGRLEALARSHEAEKQQQELTGEAMKAFGDIIAELENLDAADALRAMDSQSIKKLQEKLNHAEDRWVSAAHHAQPAAEQFTTCKEQLKFWRLVAQSAQRALDMRSALEQFHEDASHADKSDFTALKKLEKKAEKLSRKLPWPEALVSHMPREIRELDERKAMLLEQIEGLKSKQDNNLQRLESAFTELRNELEANHFKNADRVLNRIRNVIRQLEPSQQQRFQSELKPLVARLKEIHDWQGFAIEPKKVELCERMSALIGLDESPDLVAQKIKALQKEWKQLGPLSPRRDQALWKKFRAAADEAYAPCKTAFAAQAAQRRENFAQRMLLVDQLADYEKRMAWPDAPDSEAGSASPDWKIVQKTLDTARDAFGEIKPVDRKGEHKSRKALKAVCDRIYGHIKAEYERNITLKKDLVSRAQALGEMGNLSDAISQAKTIQREWKAVGVTPRQVDRRLWKDFRHACDAVFERLESQRKVRDAAVKEKRAEAEQRKRKQRQRWPNLQHRMQACATRAQDAQAAKTLWEQHEEIPRGIDTDGLEDYWKHGPDDKPSEEVLREVCIALEVLAGKGSPPEDKEARMAYQMKRLVEGMGAGQGDLQQSLLDLVNRFISLRPPPEWVDRFCSEGKITPPG
jgi:hypothetical protein